MSRNNDAVTNSFEARSEGRDFDYIHRAMPSLAREQFDAVVEYVNEHREELVEEDRCVEERIKQGIAEQKAKGLYREIDTSVPLEDRIARMRERLWRRQREQVEIPLSFSSPSARSQ